MTKVKRADPILQRRNQRGTPFTKVERGNTIHQSGKGAPHSPKFTKVQKGVPH